MFFNSIKAINRLGKEINRLLSKGMSDIFLKVTIETFSKLRFTGFKKFVTMSVFGELQLMEISLNFKTSCCNLKIRSWNKTVCGFSIILILKGIMTFQSQKSPCILLKKNINFSKNEMESKMENSTHSFREADLVLQLI